MISLQGIILYDSQPCLQPVPDILQPLMGMKRERTMVQVSDEQKAEEWQKLIKEKDYAEKNVSQEQRKQEEMVCTFIHL